MEAKTRNVLIVGQSAAAQALAKKLKSYDSVSTVYIARGNRIESTEYVSVDISEDNHTELLKFVLENDISLTIPVSNKALKSDIVSFFQANGQNIFGPCKKACTIATNKITGKKLLYKIHANTPKFGIFDKQQNALDYLSTSSFPVIIQNDEEMTICPTIAIANRFLTDLIHCKKETDVLIEDYTYGHNFSVYFITDGYSAIPFSTVKSFKFSEEQYAGEYTNGTGCYIPDFKISSEIINQISNVVQEVIKLLENKQSTYTGILGVECTLTGENSFTINNFKSFLQDYDANAILKTIDDNLIQIFDSCIHGFFSDEYEKIQTNDNVAVSAVISAKYADKKIKEFEDISDIDFVNIKQNEKELYTVKGPSFVITKSAKTLSRAKNYLKEEIDYIQFDGIKYNKDILS